KHGRVSCHPPEGIRQVFLDKERRDGNDTHLNACPPVLMTVWMTFATCSKHVQRTAREAARRISPTVRSDSEVETNKSRSPPPAAAGPAPTAS
uniref:Uncharacterized protein n=1 Tax=Scophthalmus maximus TaxID=52904 RepID=A0A8D3C494_SCOMX